MLQIWGSVHLSAPTCKLEAVAQRQRDLSGIDAPQTREKQKLLRTFGCATGLPRSQPGASLARGATRGVSPGDPCSGFSPCLRHPKKNPKPWSCRHTAMEWPRGECRYPGASSGWELLLPGGSAFQRPERDVVPCLCFYGITLPASSPSCSPHWLHLHEVNFDVKNSLPGATAADLK